MQLFTSVTANICYGDIVLVAIHIFNNNNHTETHTFGQMHTHIMLLIVIWLMIADS